MGAAARRPAAPLALLAFAFVCALAAALACAGCSAGPADSQGSARPDVRYYSGGATPPAAASDAGAANAAGSADGTDVSQDAPSAASTTSVPVSDIPASSAASSSADDRKARAKEFRKKLDLTQDLRPSFVHGDKPAEYQKYIVLHDTEGDGEASGVVDYWDGNGAGVAAHFIVNKDGSIVQCVKLNQITHHAGFGDTGHNQKYGVEDESRDDKGGTVEIGEDFADYGMNSYSIGIEMVHVGGSGDYPEEQLAALDDLIAYIDAYYGKESKIIDHKAWRTGNSDTSEEFSGYLENYQDHRTHLPKGKA